MDFDLGDVAGVAFSNRNHQAISANQAKLEEKLHKQSKKIKQMTRDTGKLLRLQEQQIEAQQQKELVMVQREQFQKECRQELVSLDSFMDKIVVALEGEGPSLSP